MTGIAPRQDVTTVVPKSDLLVHDPRALSPVVEHFLAALRLSTAKPMAKGR